MNVGDETEPDDSSAEGASGNYGASGINGSAVAMGPNAHATLSVTNIFPTRGAKSEQRDLSELGNRVHNAWIVGVLDIADTAILPRLCVEVEFTSPPGTLVPPRRARENLSAPTMYELFKKSSHAMLILGAPGSGKTHTALELVHHWLRLADEDLNIPIPVVLSLSSWHSEQRDISTWIVDELNRRYAIPRKMGRRWLAKHDIGLVLDGLDELRQGDRPRCVAEINRFREADGLNRLVVISRVDAFKELGVQLSVGAVVTLQAPSLQDVEAHVATLHSEGAESLRAAIKNTDWIRELATNPLMLGLMLQVHASSLAKTSSTPNDTVEDARARVLEAYVDRMFERRPSGLPRIRVNRVLTWLASRMSAYEQSEFLVEWLQPRWLDRSERRAYDALWAAAQGALQALAITPITVWAGYFAVNDWLEWGAPVALAVAIGGVRGLLALMGVKSAFLQVCVCGLVAGAVATALFACAADPFWALLAGPAATFVMVLVMLLTVRRARHVDVEIEPVGAVKWSWSAAVRAAAMAIVGCAFFSGGVCYVVESLTVRNFIPWFATTGALFVPGCAILAGWQPPQLLDIQSNRALFRSASTYAIAVLSSVLTGLGLFSLYISQNHRTPHMETGVVRVVLSGLGVGLALGLRWGGTPFVQHVLLRFVLAAKGTAPWRFTPVLDQAVTLALLRRVGNGYIFVHRTLLEHFARRSAPTLAPTSTSTKQ